LVAFRGDWSAISGHGEVSYLTGRPSPGRGQRGRIRLRRLEGEITFAKENRIMGNKRHWNYSPNQTLQSHIPVLGVVIKAKARKQKLSWGTDQQKKGVEKYIYKSGSLFNPSATAQVGLIRANFGVWYPILTGDLFTNIKFPKEGVRRGSN